MTIRLRTHMLLWLMATVLILGVSIAVLGIYAIRSFVVDRAQEQVKSNLKAARSVFQDEIDKRAYAFSLLMRQDNVSALKSAVDLDYLYVTEASDSLTTPSEIVRQAFRGNATSGVRIIDSAELASMPSELAERALIEVKETPKARPSSLKVLRRSMAFECAVPYFDKNGAVTRVVYGGKLVNRYLDLVDRIHNVVFESRFYDAKPVGTVTIFLDDVRIATNVLDRNGARALGTRVSEVVYHSVVEQGTPWIGEAFVVTDWFLTAYEPIRNVNGTIIGILYTGALKKPLEDMKRRLLLAFLLIVGLSALFTMAVAWVLATAESRPLTAMMRASERLSNGSLGSRVSERSNVREITHLASAFNSMAHKLEEREAALRLNNDKLAALNKSYLDLVGMVSHEIKGAISSTVLNAYSVRDGYLGPLNDAQTKAITSVARNLDNLTATVRNFLDLSRIEKDELAVSPVALNVRKDLVEYVFETFMRLAKEKNVTLHNATEPAQQVCGDRDLLRIVLSNLVNNAIKYGSDGGAVRVSSRSAPGAVEVEVYNDGTPIPLEQQERLFQRFSRLDQGMESKVHGTGLGLFITKQIVERHGGSIRIETRTAGNSFVVSLPATQGEPAPGR